MGRNVMEQIKTKEMMSALADGQLEGEDFERGLELATTDPLARGAWHAYHLIGDVLRSSDLAAGTPSQVFLSRLQVRLEQEASPATALQPPPAAAHEGALAQAANDGNFRWKLLAGFASLAAIGTIAWTVALTPGKSDGGQMAATPSAGTVLASSERGVMVRDPRLDELMAAHRQLGGAALVAPAGYVRNAAFDGQGR
jgi:sigma-E factor negative regulatory protein RseA